MNRSGSSTNGKSKQIISLDERQVVIMSTRTPSIILRSSLSLSNFNLFYFSKLINTDVYVKSYHESGRILSLHLVNLALILLRGKNKLLVIPDPTGVKIDQDLIKRITDRDIIILCPNLSGYDERIKILYPNHLLVSLGDFILSSGDPCVRILIDLLDRQKYIEKIDKEKAGIKKDSLVKIRLGGSQNYGCPRMYKGLSVPSILLSGNHGEIERYRFKKSLK
jgi:tRNA (guanine37-N1)-methyltransferase